MVSKVGTATPGEWCTRDRVTYTVLLLLALVTSAAGALLPPMTGIIVPILGVPSDDWIGYIVTSFLLISGFASIGWAYLADCTTRRRLLVISTILWIALFIPILHPSINYWTLFLFYGIAAIGIGATGPLTLSLTIDCVPNQWRATTIGVLGTASGMGYGAGFIISGLLVETFNWQMPFLIIILLGIGSSLFLFFTKEPPRGQHEEGLAELYRSGGAYTYRISLKELSRMWRKPSNIWLIIVGIIAIIPTAAFGAWAVRWLNVDHSLGIFVSTQFMTLALASQIGGNVFFGRLGDMLFGKNKQGRARLILLCCLCAGPILIMACLYAFTVPPTVTIIELLLNPISLAFFLLVFVGTFFDAGISPLIYVSAGDINPPEIRSTAMSLHLLAHIIGVSLGTQLTPSIAVIFFSGIYSPSLAVICLGFFAAALFTLPILRHIRADIDVTNEEIRKRANHLTRTPP